MSGLTQAVALFATGLALQAFGLFVVYGDGVAAAVIGSELAVAGVASIIANVKAGTDVR